MIFTPSAKAQLRAMVEVLDPVAAAPAPVPAPPAPTPPPPPPAPAPVGPVMYFSPAGNNTNPGTATSTKLNLVGLDVNSLAAGTTLLFERGGVYSMGSSAFKLRNLNTTAASRLTFQDYGTGTRPVLQWSSGVTIGIEFGLNFSDNTPHAGYVFRNLILRAPADQANSWAFWCKGSVADVLIEDCALENWYMGLEGQGGQNATRIQVLRCTFPNNRGMCIHGCYFDLLAEGNDFSDATVQASHFVHRIYLRNGDRAVIRNNSYVTDQPCQGGTYTFHGYMPTSTVVEGNTAVYGAGSDEGAWPISFFPDAPGGTVGGFGGVVVRGNLVRGPGNNGIHVECAPNALIENNTVELPVARNTVAIVHRNDNEIPINLSGTCTMRNNIARGPVGSTLSYSSAPGSTESNNTVVII